jgi:hypothetical protein
MPIILVSWDSPNTTLPELYTVVDQFDRVYLELTESANELVNQISEQVHCEYSTYISDLTSDKDPKETWSTLMERIGQIKRGNILVVSRQSFFKAVGHTVSEWEPLSLQGF